MSRTRGKLSRLRRGRSTPDAASSSSDQAELESATSSSRASSAAPSERGGGSPSASLPGSARAVTPRQPARSALATALLRALLPALVLALTAASLHRRQQWHASIAEGLVAAETARLHHAQRLAAAGHYAQQQQQAPDAGHACAEALQVPQVPCAHGLALPWQHRMCPLRPAALAAALIPPQHTCRPQVAMLFLVKGPLRHEAMWHQWFERAAGLLPAQAVSNALCASEDGMPDALAACSSLARGDGAAADASRGTAAAWAAAGHGGSGGGRSRGAAAAAAAGGLAERLLGGVPGLHGRPAQRSVLERQHLFDVYVHPHPNFTGALCMLRALCCIAELRRAEVCRTVLLAAPPP